jgi:hypothetical protein
MTHARTLTGASVAFLVLSITGYSSAQPIRCITWNLQWFPNGSAHEASISGLIGLSTSAASLMRWFCCSVDWKAKIRWQTPAKRINHASRITIPTEVAKGRPMGKDAADKHDNSPNHRPAADFPQRTESCFEIHIARSPLCVFAQTIETSTPIQDLSFHSLPGPAALLTCF